MSTCGGGGLVGGGGVQTGVGGREEVSGRRRRALGRRRGRKGSGAGEVRRKKMKWERQRPSLPIYSLRGGRGSRILRAHDRCNRSEKMGNGRPRSSHIVGHDPLDQNCRWAFKAHRSRGGTAVSKALEGLPDGTRRQNTVQASEVCEFQGRFVSQVGDTWPACIWSQFKYQCRSAN